ncbi:tetratricopeptide repeat-containing sensor histidine kinase [Flagellimonas nanhaiensis]|uniref:histidine kinase n=1 Tax=Flagellimonas nanhaiensis TaxID=2292706 RepID=A0A371JP12_9FLAO|nr:tetratricopeptide repeat protein [Allomuricauda nanhaiensis]RDY59272.1 hypothetical protein DX873_07695 [Allomuricauda nanhaiensis]
MVRYFLLIVLLSMAKSFGQDLDSLLVQARESSNDSIKIDWYNRAAFGYIFRDSEKAGSILDEAFESLDSLKNSYGLAVLTNTKAIYMDVGGQSDLALKYFSKAHKISKANGYHEIAARAVNGLGMVHWNKGEFETALDYFFEAQKGYEQLGNRKSMAVPLNNIGLIYQELLQYKKALEFHEKSYALRLEFDLKRDQATSLNNMGICSMRLNRLDEAFKAFQKGLEAAEQSGNMYEYHQILGNLGDLYRVQGKTDLAIQTFLRRLNMPQQLQNNQRGQLITYTDLVDLYNESNQPQTALVYATKANEILKIYPHYTKAISDFPLFLAETYFRLGNNSEARNQLKKYNQVKDSVFSNRTSKQLSELEVKYETEKKDKEILLQRANLAEQQLLIQTRNWQLAGLSIFMILLVCIGYLIYSRQRLKQQQAAKENELKLTMEKINAKNRLQEERLRISRELHDNIGAQLTFIISSLDNMKMTLPSEEGVLNNKLNEVSDFARDTIVELRDTIWAMNKGSINLADLKIRIANFIEKAELTTLKTEFNFDFSEDAEALTFSSSKGISIYRVIQEALNNAIKHSGADHVKVNFSGVGKKLSITVEDDGNGFDMNKVDKGNGLMNMKKRALEIAGELQVNSDRQKGTVIQLKVPLAS